MSPLDRQLLFVTGKGGTGKTTVAAALGIAAARHGLATVLVEVGNQARMAPLFGVEPGPPGEEVQIGAHLWSTTVEPYRVMEDWVARILQSRSLSSLLTRTNFFRTFAEAAPGGRELGTIVKTWELAQRERWDRRAQVYDLVIVDAPASGHAIGLLRTPSTFHDIARVGPIASQSRRVRDFLADPQATGYLAVGLATELAVSETLGLETRLQETVGRDFDEIVVNAILPARFSDAELDAVAAAADGTLAGALAEVRGAELRADVQREHLDRLSAEAVAPVYELPFLFADPIGRREVEVLSDRLDW